MDQSVPETQWLDRAFKLACFIHRDRATAVQIVTEARSKLEIASAAQDKRLYYTPTGRSSRHKSRNKLLLGEAHLLQIWKAVGSQDNIAAIFHSFARLERNRSNLSEALAKIDAALEIIEWMRAKAVIQELRSAFLGSVQVYYEFKIEVLTQLAKRDPSKDYTASAFQVGEMARARSLLETLIEAGADIRQDVSPALIERERGIQQQLSAKAAEQMRLLDGESTKEQLAEVERQIEELTARYHEVQAEIRTTSPRYAALTQPEPLGLVTIQQQLLDSQTVLLEYFLGAERSYLWLVAPDSIKGYELPKREEIEKSASRVYELLTARNRRVRFEIVDEKRARIERQTPSTRRPLPP